MKTIDREEVGDVRTFVGIAKRSYLCQLTVLRSQLSRRRNLNRLNLAERPLRKG